ncbi:MAG TPA: hypothetical protein VGN12_27315 [Pirellulales bacterium]|jgi:hypothetical protein
MNALLCCVALLAAHDETYLAWVAEPVAQTALPASTGETLSAAQLAEIEYGQPTFPFSDVTTGTKGSDGSLWVGSQHGLTLLAPGATRWRVFHSRHWLPADDVQELSLITSNEVAVKTSAGVARIKQSETTLDQKMAEINDNIQKHHLRFGLVGDIHLKEPGNLAAGYVQQTNDNDGLWTSLYVAAEAFRYGATGDPQAKKNARAALEALMFLERITGIPGFVARSVLPIDDDSWKHGGEWHKSADGRWWWKGDTSSDEVDGHFFAYSIYHDVAATAEEKKEISAYVARITDHIIDHGFYYVGPPGKPTTWGVWAPEALNHDLKRLGDRGLNSLEILSHLKVADHIVGKPRYAAAAKDLIENHSYATNTVLQKSTWPMEMANHSDDELAFTAYYPLVIYERDPDLRAKYMASLKRTWLVERPERSPFFNFIYAAGVQANTWTDPLARPDAGLIAAEDYDLTDCLEWFREVPPDTTRWGMKNSHRRDVAVTFSNRFKRARGNVVLPIAERHVMKWNGDPYQLDHGGDGRARDDGTFILLPYWMGRYRRLLE